MSTKLTYTGAEVQELLDKIGKGDFDNAKTLEGHPASYFAVASELTSLAESFATEQGRINTLYSYFNNGSANDALSLGGQLPSYYATALQYEILQQTLTDFKSLFDSMFEKDIDGNIHAKLSLWSSGGITAGGVGSGGSVGGGGISYNRLDSWADYSADKAGYVLSAALGKDLDNRVSALANAGYITASYLAPYALRSEMPSLVGYATQSWVGDNYLSKSGGVITGQGDTRYVQLRLDGEMSTVMFQQRGIEKGAVGWGSAIGVRLQNTNAYGLAVTDSNDPIYYWGQNGSVQRILLHTGNYADYITNSYLKSTLGISDWALAATKPTYTASEVGALAVSEEVNSGSLNDYTTAGIYRFNVIGDAIAGMNNYGNLLVVRGGNYDTLAQLYFNHTDGKVFIRSSNLQLFPYANWNQIAFTSDIPTKLSQLTDDVVAGKYLPLSGGTVNGSIYMNGYFRLGNSQPIMVADTNRVYQSALYLSTGNNLLIGYGTSVVGKRRTLLFGNTIEFKSNSGEDNTLVLNADRTATFSSTVSAPSFIGNLTGNADSATKLATPRSIWGQSFDGTGDITGDIMFAGPNKIAWHNDKNYYYISSPTTSTSAYLEYNAYGGHSFLGGNVTIGGGPAYERLYVYGNGKFTGALTVNSLTIGGVTLTYDSGNEALCINGNMYALGGVTAGGAGISAYTSLEARVARIEQQLNIS